MNSQKGRTKASETAAAPLPRTNRIARDAATAAEGRQATGVFVLGMHRSGTSALTRILNLMGVELGEQLLGANSGNASGHWESIPVMEVNERVLAALGMSWSDPRTMAQNWLDYDEVVRLLPEARLAAGKELLQARLWAVKDPRISRLLNFWKAALATEESIRLTAVIALRHPFEVASSLLRRDEIPLSVGMLLWYLHTVDALRSSHGMARVVVDYSDLMKDWKHELSRIESDLDLGLPEVSQEIEAQVDGFLDSNLWHERSAGDDQVPEKLMQLYHALKAAKSETSILEAQMLADSMCAYTALHDSAIRDIHIHRERLRQRVMVLEIEFNDSLQSRDVRALAAIEHRLETISTHIAHADWVNSQLEERCRNTEQDAMELRAGNDRLASDFEWVQRQLQRMARTSFGVNEMDCAPSSAYVERIAGLMNTVAQHVAEANWVSSELERLNKDSQKEVTALVERNRELEEELGMARVESASKEEAQRTIIDELKAQVAELGEQRSLWRATWYWRIRQRLRGPSND